MNVIRKIHMINFLKDRLKEGTVNLIIPDGIFDFILFVNVRKGIYTRKYEKETSIYKMPEGGRYADFLKELQKRVCSGKEEFYEDMKLIRVIGALAVKEKYIVACGFRTGDGTYQDDTRHLKFTFIRNTLYEKSDKQKENIVVFCEDITEMLIWGKPGGEPGRMPGGHQDKMEILQKRLVYLAHEIRTSLNGIYGNLKMLHEEVYPQNKYFRNAFLSAEYLLNLVNGVLNISTLEDGGIGRIEAVTMEELVKYPEGAFAYEAEKRNIQVQFVCGRPVYRYLYLNRTAIQQVLINLLSNAVKYTKDGGSVVCRMAEIPMEEKRVRLLLEVSDTGIGMEETFLAGVWKPYEREWREKSAEGSGLGLALTRYLVEMLHGTIHIESRSGIGTCVSAAFDVDGDDMLYKPEEGPEKTSEQEEIPVKRALVAEDEDANMEVICAYLEKMGIAADKTYDGEEVLEIFRQSEEAYYDVILMDIHLPVQSGIEAAKEIRSMKRKDSGIPIIAMTGDVWNGRVPEEMSVTVGKPYREEDLRSALQACCKSQAKTVGDRKKAENHGRIGGTQTTGKRSGHSSAESTLYF